MVPFWTMPATILSGTAAAAGIALIASVGSIGNLISPIVIGWIATRTGSLAAGHFYLAGVTLAGALALACLNLARTTVTPRLRTATVDAARPKPRTEWRDPFRIFACST
jgi:MFS family permease